MVSLKVIVVAKSRDSRVVRVVMRSQSVLVAVWLWSVLNKIIAYELVNSTFNFAEVYLDGFPSDDYVNVTSDVASEEASGENVTRSASSTETVTEMSLTPTPHSRQAFRAKIVSIFIKGDKLQLSYDHRLTKPAIDIAIEKVNKIFDPYLQFDVTHRTGYNTCEENFAGAYAAEEHLTKGKVSLFVGPACPTALDSVARLASYWNIPICTVGGLSSQFDNNAVFSTLIRLSVTTKGILGTFTGVMKHFKWHHVAVLTDLSHQISESIRNALQESILMNTGGYAFEARFEDFNYKKDGSNYTELLQRASQSARSK